MRVKNFYQLFFRIPQILDLYQISDKNSFSVRIFFAI